MSKKEKKVNVLADNFKAVIAVMPKLEKFLQIHDEIAVSYQKYRNNGGVSIPGIEKHLGSKKQPANLPAEAKKPENPAKAKKPNEAGKGIKTKGITKAEE